MDDMKEPKTSEGSAAGKVILFGEHAVVYGRPAIAVPVSDVRACVTVTEAGERGDSPADTIIEAHDLGRRYSLREAAEDDPLAVAARLSLERLGVGEAPPLRIEIRSRIPLGRGMGSGAAVSVAVARALAAHFRADLPTGEVSAIAYEVEKIHHGTPSGIDNTVIAFGCPVYFVRGRPIERLGVGAPFTLVIGDTGVVSPTRDAVAAVRERWEKERDRYERIFDRAGEIARRAKEAIEKGQTHALGGLMDANQSALEEMGVSSKELGALVEAARKAGAPGAKLSGAGLGGNMIALAPGEPPDTKEKIARALRDAGATGIIITEVR